jgi:hypothetical protein
MPTILHQKAAVFPRVLASPEELDHAAQSWHFDVKSTPVRQSRFSSAHTFKDNLP